MKQNEGDMNQIEGLIAGLKEQPGALLPILHAVQDLMGYVPKEAVPIIAEGLNLSRAEVHGVLSFYHYFRQSPPGRKVIHLCRAESCKSMGADQLEAHAKSVLGADYHENSPDGAFTLEPVYCLGNCAASPAIMIDQDVFGRVTPERFDEILLEEGAKS